MKDRGPEDGGDGRSLALAIAFGLLLGTVLGSVGFAFTGEIVWMAMAPGVALMAGLLYHQVANG